MENIEHHLIQGQIAKAIENLFSNKAFRASAQDAQKDYQLPENLVDAIVSRNDDREWEYLKVYQEGIKPMVVTPNIWSFL